MRFTAINLMCLEQALIIVISWLFVAGCLSVLEGLNASDSICGDRLDSAAYFWLGCVRRYGLAIIVLPVLLGIIWYRAARRKSSDDFPTQQFIRFAVLATLAVVLTGCLLMVQAWKIMP